MSKIALLFPGQGAQSIGMATPFLDAAPAAKSLFDKASEILGYDLLQVCSEGPVEKLDSTAVSQPAIFVTSLAVLEVLKQQKPDVLADATATAGLSLGEYTALVFGGALSFEAGVKLVKERGEAMQAAADSAPSTMLSILGLEREKIEEICNEARQPGEVLQIANLLCPGNIVVSGHKPSCAQGRGTRHRGRRDEDDSFGRRGRISHIDHVACERTIGQGPSEHDFQRCARSR